MNNSQYIQLAPDLSVCRVINGMWQVSGAHGAINPRNALNSMFTYFDAGLTTWDLAEHYGPAESLMGEFRRQLRIQRGETAVNQLQVFTTWVSRPEKMTLSTIEESINCSLRRMQVESLDLLQFHWWDYQDQRYLEVLSYLSQLQQKGKIKYLALTNFDTKHLKIVVDTGIKVISNQIQYSLMDQRPSMKMTQLCQENKIHLLAYGSMAGGFFSIKYWGHPDPKFVSLTTASLRKYKKMIDRWGGWGAFQKLLGALKTIAHKHKVTIPNVAMRYILDQSQVAGIIVGVRLGISDHLTENQQLFDFQLDTEDYQILQSLGQQSHRLLEVIGDCGNEYRLA
ncbi:MAG: aldo/keto reductase [Microcystaceae cyanobacterium]